MLRLSLLCATACLLLAGSSVEASARHSHGEEKLVIRHAPSTDLEKKLEARKVDWRTSLYSGVDRAAGITPDTDVPSQIKLSFVPKGMAVSFATQYPYAAPSEPTVYYGTSPDNLAFTATGNETSTYGTLFFHTVLLFEVSPNNRYYYRVNGTSTVQSFVTAKHAGDPSPFSILSVGDMGLANSAATMAQLNAHLNDTDWFLHIGDLSYADDFFLRPGNTYEGSWDAWQDQMEAVTSFAPYMSLPGNHEVTCDEVTPFLCPPQQKNFTAYTHRFRMPWRESGGAANLWYSFDYGLVHFVQINTETDFPNAPMGPGTYWNGGGFGDQLGWLEADLEAAQANRNGVPWIIVSGHRPWYTSKGKGCQSCQAAFEALLLKYNVDIVFSGHVHWYERLWPLAAGGVVTQQNYTNPSVPVYITNGGAGNVEGLNVDAPKPYSAFIQDTDFGYGRLSVANDSAIHWEYFLSKDGSLADEMWLTKTR